MPNGDLNHAVHDLKRRLDENDNWQKEIARIVERLTTIVIGDPTINHKGLVERVQGHETFITEANTKASETKGSRKTLLLICGVAGAILSKLVDTGFQILTAHVGK